MKRTASKMTVSGLYLSLLLVFFFFMLLLPTAYQVERGVFLAVLVLGALVYALAGHWQVNKTILLWLLSTVTAGLMFVWNGILHGAPGAFRLGTVHVVWPLLYVFFIGILRKAETLIVFHKTIVLGILGSAVMGIVLVTSAVTGYGEGLSEWFKSQDADAGFYDGFTRYRLPNVATLIYGIGFVLGVVAIRRSSRWCTQGWTVITWITLVVMLIAIVLSGRRAAWLVVLLIPFVIFGLMVMSGQKFRVRYWLLSFSLVVFVVSTIHLYLDLQVSALMRELKNAFDITAEEAASMRSLQSDVLIAGWADRPIFGHGLGTGSDIVQSIDQPWAYELSYLALLFQTGLVGILIYSGGVLWIFWMGILTVRRLPQSATVILPLLSGLAGFLIANATNPYLAKFDYLWVIFLPIAAINVYTVRAHRVLIARPAVT